MRFVALWLSGICILVFIFQLMFGTDLFVLYSSVVWQEPWRLLTSIFAHASLSHLISNLWALALFGLILEGAIGPEKVLYFFLGSGLLINLFSLYPSSLGASGAIYAIIGALMVLRPWFIIWINFLPVPMLVAGFFYLVQDALGLFAPSDVGHLAHISGLFIGIIVAFLFWREKRDNKKDRKNSKESDKLIDKELDDYERSHGLR